MGAGRRLVLGVLLALVAAGAGCRSESPEQPTTLLRVLMTDDWVTTPFVDAVRSFERDHPNVRVVVEKGPIVSTADAVRAGISSGAPPDVVQGHAASAAGQDLAQPLDDLWAGRIDPGEFFPGALDDVTWGGRRYGVPLDTNALVLLYNVDLLRQVGVPEPGSVMTFGEFEAVVRSLSAAGSPRGFVIPNNAWWTYGWIKANGGEIADIDDQGKVRLSLDAPEAVQALSFLQGLIQKGYAIGPRAIESHNGDALALFATGQVAFHASGSWDLVGLRRFVPGVQFRAAPMPLGITGATQGSAMGGSSLWVPRGATHRELAFEFMTHLTSDEHALRFAKEEGRLPARARVFADPFFDDPDMQIFLRQLKTAYPHRLGAFDEPSKAFSAAIEGVLRNVNVEPQPALQRAQRTALASLQQ